MLKGSATSRDFRAGPLDCAAVEVALTAGAARTGETLCADPHTLAGTLMNEVSAGEYVGG